MTPEEEAKSKETIEKINPKDEEEVKAELDKEEGVETSQVVLMDGEGTNYVLVDITLEEDADIDEKQLAEKYGKQLKEKYADRVVDVKVTKGEEEIHQVKFE